MLSLNSTFLRAMKIGLFGWTARLLNQPYETLRIFRGPDAYLPETKSRTRCATSMESSSLPMGILRIMLAEDGVGQVLMALTGVKVGQILLC